MTTDTAVQVYDDGGPVSQPDGFAGEPTVSLTLEEIHAAYAAAAALWRKPMVEILKSGLIWYNSIHMLDTTLLGVYDYLCGERNAAKAALEVKK